MTRVDALTDRLRQEILEGARAPGQRLIEQELTTHYDVARHSLRTALRTLQAEGLVTIEANKGARVARLDASQISALYEYRTALEVEAAKLALARHRGRLPAPVHAALETLERACPAAPWSEINDAHAQLHHAIVQAAESARIEQAHTALSGEMRLFLAQLEPLWSRERMAADHVALVRGLERDGPAVLREHLRESAAALIAAEGVPGG